MDELCFQASLLMDEIEENFRDFDLFAGLMASLEEVLGLHPQRKHARRHHT